MDTRGGTITWYLDADDSQFDVTVRKVREQAAITARSVDRDLKRGTDGANNSLRNFRIELAKSASLFRNFQIATRGFTMTTLILSVVAATGAVVELSGAILATGGLINTLPAILGVAAGAIGTITVATSGMGDAFKAVAEGDAKKINEAMQNLSPNARSVVSAFSRLNESFKSIQRAVQDNFFDELGNAMDAVAKATLPTLDKGLNEVASSMNLLVREAARVAQEPFFQGAIAGSLDTTAESTSILTQAVRPLAEATAGLLAVGNPYVILLSEWLVKQSKLFGAYASSAKGQAKLTEQVDLGITALQSIGSLAGSLIGLLVELFKQSNDSGLSFIDTLKGAVDGMTAFLKSAKGSEQFQSFIRDTNLILESFIEIIGDIIGFLLQLSDGFDKLSDPTKEFITKIVAIAAVAGPVAIYLGAIATSLKLVADGIGLVGKAIIAHPIIFAIAVAFTAIATALTILEEKFGLVTKSIAILQEAFKPLYDFFVANILPILKEIWGVLEGQLKVTIEAVAKELDVIAKAFQDAGIDMDSMKLAAIAVGAALAVLLAPITIVIGLIGGLVFVVLKAIEIFANFQTTLFKFARQVGEALGEAGRTISEFFQNPGRFIDEAVKLGKNIWEGLGKGIQSAVDGVKNKLKEFANGALDTIKSFFGIKSPSRVMAKMGSFIMEGLQNGIAKTGEAVISTARGVSNSILDTFGTVNGTTISASINGSVSDVNGVASAVDSNAAGTSVAEDNSRKVNITQYNTVNNNVDMDLLNKELGWRLANT